MGRAKIKPGAGRPSELLGGGKSDVSLRFTAPTLAFDLNGTVNVAPTLVVEGAVSAQTPNLRALASNLGLALPWPSSLEGAALAGALRATRKTTAITDLRLTLDANVYEGALALDADRPRPMLSGTLAAETLDTTPLLAQLPELVDAAGEWRRARLPLAPPSPYDVDLRLSASRAKIGRAQLRDAAFSLAIMNDVTKIEIKEARAFNGQIKAHAIVRRGPNGYAIETTTNLAKVDSAALMSEVFRSPRLSGEVSGDIGLASEGETLGRLLRGLTGEANLVMKHGDIAGLDLEQALRRLEKRPLSIASEVRNGRTAFEDANLQLRIENGRAQIQQLQARGPGVQFEVTGAIGVPERALDLKLEAAQSSKPASARDAGPWLSMNIHGRWNDPELTLDARSLINRSQAAAPLLREGPPVTPTGAEENSEPR